MARVLPIKQRIAKLIKRVNGCWEWQGHITKLGYGQIGVGSRTDKSRRTIGAHRLSYETFVGPIPGHLVLDHLCRNRACVNPDHLETVTTQENVLRGDGIASINARKKSCVNGHLLDGINLYTQKSTGKRYCRECNRARTAKWAKQHA